MKTTQGNFCVVIVFLFFLINSNGYAQLSFTVNSSSGSFSITCANPTLNLIATSNYTASPVSFTWTNPQLVTIISNSLAATTPGIYTTTAASGTLVNTQTISIVSNTTAPSLTLTGSNPSVSCSSPTVLLTGVASPTSVTFLWIDFGLGFPCTTHTFIASWEGVYNLTITSLVNGCKNSATLAIGDNKIYPVFGAIDLYTISCPGGTVNLSPPIIFGAANLVFKWSGPPGAITNGTNTSVLNTNLPGDYTVTATNTVNGCESMATISVWACVGLEEESNYLNSVKAFPNPIKDKLLLEYDSENFSVENLSLSNSLGQKLFSFNDVRSGQEIDLSLLHGGIYFLTMQTTMVYKTLKLLKE